MTGIVLAVSTASIVLAVSTASIVLAVSTASPALSLALFDAGRVIAHDHRIIGRGHAEAIMPAIAAMLAGRERAGAAPVDAVLVDIGPGSFTGIRIGIAAARALGLAWDVPVTGFSGAALVAAQAFAARPGLAAVRVLLDAGRGQLLVSDWDADFGHGDTQTLAAGDIGTELAVAGGGAALLPDNGGWTIVHAGEPDAAFALALPPAARSRAPAAHYIRPPDAILPLG